jgi:hypothetical protein
MKSLPMNRRRKMTEAWKKVDNSKVVSESCYFENLSNIYFCVNYKLFLTAEAVLVTTFTSPPPLSNSVKNASSIAIMLSRHYYGIY